MSAEQIKSSLLSVKGKLISPKDLSLLIEFCRVLAEKYLLVQRSSILQLCERNGISLFDLSTDIVADIFRKNDDDRFAALERFISSFAIPFGEVDQTHVYFAFKKFVLKKANSRLKKVYAETDPVGTKIHRNIKNAVKKSEDFEFIEDFRGKVLQIKNDDSAARLPEFPPEILERTLIGEINRKIDMPEILTVLASVLTGQEEFRRSVPLFDLVKMLKRFYLEPDEDVTETSGSIETDASAEDIQAAKVEELEFVYKTVFHNYYPKKIKNRDDAEKLFNALQEIISGYSQIEEDHSVEKAIRKHFLLTHDEYKDRWQALAEYIVKLAKRHYRALLEDIF